MVGHYKLVVPNRKSAACRKIERRKIIKELCRRGGKNLDFGRIVFSDLGFNCFDGLLLRCSADIAHTVIAECPAEIIVLDVFIELFQKPVVRSDFFEGRAI